MKVLYDGNKEKVEELGGGGGGGVDYNQSIFFIYRQMGL